MPERMILQSRPGTSDGWRDVIRFGPTEAPQVQRAAEMLSNVGVVYWRVLCNDNRRKVLAVHDGRRWHVTGEAVV